MFKKLLLFLGLSLTSYLSFSQSTDVSGTIKDTTSGYFVKNAVVAELSHPG